jgi:hypothetical protein
VTAADAAPAASATAFQTRSSFFTLFTSSVAHHQSGVAALAVPARSGSEPSECPFAREDSPEGNNFTRHDSSGRERKE